MNASRILKALIKMSTESWTISQNSAVIVGVRRRERHLHGSEAEPKGSDPNS